MEPNQYGGIVGALPSAEPDVAEPKWNKALGNFFRQRNDQRKFLFSFALATSILSLVLLSAVVIWQGVVRTMGNEDFLIISDQGLQILAVAIFGQVFGVVYIIANAIWSNHEFDLMGGKTDKK